MDSVIGDLVAILAALLAAIAVIQAGRFARDRYRMWKIGRDTRRWIREQLDKDRDSR
jgi:hypothetical protein